MGVGPSHSQMGLRAESEPGRFWLHSPDCVHCARQIEEEFPRDGCLEMSWEGAGGNLCMPALLLLAPRGEEANQDHSGHGEAVEAKVVKS